MMPNVLILLAAAVIPFVLSFIWYSPKLFGGENWNKIADISAEKAKIPFAKWKGLVSIVFNFFIAFGLYGLCIHQAGVFSLVGGEVEALQSGIGAEFMAAYGGDFLTFGHGMLHGVIAAICFVFPLVMYNVFFEKKSAKYFWVNFGFWVISFALMGGVIGQWGAVPV